jgi:methionyl aminopeptidase
LIYKKSPEEIAVMREGGKILVAALDRVAEAIAPGVTTAELDGVFAEAIAERGATASFKGYRGFPASICASPNGVIVHGIPDGTRLMEGDVISLDFGVFYEGFHTDSAWTFPVGEVDPAAAELLKITEASLDAAIAQCRPGNRLGDVGHAVEEVAEAAGFSIVREYAGHGVGRALHEDPWIPNYGPPARREVLSPGMTLAIEPMVNAGGAGTQVMPDGWAVVTSDGSLSAHFEHTVAITPDGHEVLTARTPA